MQPALAPFAAPHEANPVRVSSMLTHALVDVVQQRGIAPEALLDQGALERSLSLAEYQALLARAIRLTGEPALGLQVGMYATEASFGLMSPLVSHASTLRHAIAVLVRFHPILLEGAEIRFAERQGIARVSSHVAAKHGELDPSFVELMVAGLARTLRTFGCTRKDVRAVSFEYARPSYAQAYGRVFAGMERFGQSFTGVEFVAHVLDRPHLHSQSNLHGLILAQAESALEYRSRPMRASERVQALLRSREPRDAPDMVGAARELGLSVRSLRRRLLEEGTTFRDLTQAVLFESACSLLRAQTMTLQGVAHRLGFADATAFHRAFRRWAKLTPSAYRAGASPLGRT